MFTASHARAAEATANLKALQHTDRQTHMRQTHKQPQVHTRSRIAQLEGARGGKRQRQVVPAHVEAGLGCLALENHQTLNPKPSNL